MTSARVPPGRRKGLRGRPKVRPAGQRKARIAQDPRLVDPERSAPGFHQWPPRCGSRGRPPVRRKWRECDQHPPNRSVRGFSRPRAVSCSGAFRESGRVHFQDLRAGVRGPVGQGTRRSPGQLHFSRKCGRIRFSPGSPAGTRATTSKGREREWESGGEFIPGVGAARRSDADELLRVRLRNLDGTAGGFSPLPMHILPADPRPASDRVADAPGGCGKPGWQDS